MKSSPMAGMIGVTTLLLTSGAQAQSNGEDFTGMWQTVDNGILITVDVSPLRGRGETMWEPMPAGGYSLRDVERL
jgi:hypothetical protein